MRWKSRFVAFMVCFAIGFLVASIVARLLSRKLKEQSQTTISPCATADYFNSPEEVLEALKHPEVDVRRAILSQLLLRPDVATVYYDYERDLNYPERVDRARIQYVQLDDSPEAEALVTFVRFDHPLALVFKRKSCGWHLVTALSSWLRFEDYPYENWLTTPQTIEPGVYQLLIRDSYGDATSYVRKARLLRLHGDVLTQVAEIEEEAIEPVNGYDGADWNDVKRHRINNYGFLDDTEFQGATISSEVTEEIIKLAGDTPLYSYWLETDGSWHTRKSNWSRRAATRVKLIGVSTKMLHWNSQDGRFVSVNP
jgi:hypothetical protein